MNTLKNKERITTFVHRRIQTSLVICPFAGPSTKNNFIAGK
jgi:hypothetical protein